MDESGSNVSLSALTRALTRRHDYVHTDYAQMNKQVNEELCFRHSIASYLVFTLVIKNSSKLGCVGTSHHEQPVFIFVANSDLVLAIDF